MRKEVTQQHRIIGRAQARPRPPPGRRAAGSSDPATSGHHSSLDPLSSRAERKQDPCRRLRKNSSIPSYIAGLPKASEMSLGPPGMQTEAGAAGVARYIESANLGFVPPVTFTYVRGPTPTSLAVQRNEPPAAPPPTPPPEVRAHRPRHNHTRRHAAGHERASVVAGGTLRRAAAAAVRALAAPRRGEPDRRLHPAHGCCHARRRAPLLARCLRRSWLRMDGRARPATPGDGTRRLCAGRTGTPLSRRRSQQPVRRRPVAHTRTHAHLRTLTHTPHASGARRRLTRCPAVCGLRAQAARLRAWHSSWPPQPRGGVPPAQRRAQGRWLRRI
jgi:hypothetical protein